MRVLYDISALGLGQISTHARRGSHRAERELAGMLSASPACDVVFCANHSSLAHRGCVEYLRGHPDLARVPLIQRQGSWITRGLSQAIAEVHRGVRQARGGRALPHLLRTGGALIDTRVHRPVVDTTPRADIHHSGGTPLPARLLRRRSPERFVTIHDVRATRFPVSDAERVYQEALIRSVGERDWIITSSESTRQELCEMGVASPERIAVAPLAAHRATFHPSDDGGAIVRHRFGIPAGPYLLVLRDEKPRKNVAKALEAFARLVLQEHIDDLTLVLAGDRPTTVDPIGAAVDRLPWLRGRVVETGYVSDEDLASLYRGALALVYPSLYEGFGLPPLEAMQCGTPVITSNASSLPEVVGDAGVMVDASDTDALSAAMLELWRNDALRASLRRRGLARASCFSWERTLASILGAYRAALDR